MRKIEAGGLLKRAVKRTFGENFIVHHIVGADVLFGCTRLRAFRNIMHVIFVKKSMIAPTILIRQRSNT